MRKLISLLLALVMVMSFATVAFAAEGEESTTYEDMSTVTIDKIYTVTNEGTSYPDETFSFAFLENTYVVEDGGVGSDEQKMPTLGTVEFTTENGTATKQMTITLPEYTAVGKYTYTLQEVAGDTAGVVYSDDVITLIVYVIQGEDGLIRIAGVNVISDDTKINEIENVYNAGELSISKTVTGILGDKNAYFAIDVTLTPVEGEDYTGNVISVGTTSYENNPTEIAADGETYTFYLKDNETITLGNIPYGVSYEVSEHDYTKDGYDAVEDVTGKIEAATASADFVNNKDGDIDTGIELDSIPFVVMMVVCAAAAVLFVIKRRSVEF